MPLIGFPLLLAAAAPAACPATSGGAPLTGATVYDGPVEENASLVPDTETHARGATVDGWDIGYIYRAGRQVYLTCAYPRRPTVTVHIAQPVAACRFTTQGRAKSLACG